MAAKKVLACDLDGVIFDFNRRYAEWANSMHGCTAPMPSKEYPNSWNAYQDDGHVTKEQDRDFWKWNAGVGNYCFWRFLPTYEWAKPFLAKAMAEFDEVHFITARPGERSKKASEDALWVLGVQSPLVIIAHHKVAALKSIGATHFLDDRDKNFEDILNHNLVERSQTDGVPKTMDLKMFMLDQPWNRHFSHPHVQRVATPDEIFA